MPTSGGTPRRLTTGNADTSPAWSPDGVADRVPPRRPGAPAGRRRRRARAGHRPAARRRRSGVEPGRRPARVHRAGRPRTAPARWSPTGSTTRPTAPGCSARSAASCTWSTSPPASAARSPTAPSTPAQPAWSPDGTHHRLHPRGRARTATCASASPSTCSTWTTRRRCPGWSRSPTGSPARSRTPPTARACSSSAGPGDPVGHARLFRVPLDGGVPVDLTGSLDRNVMPGAPAYPGGLPAGDRRRPDAVLRPRPRVHPPVVGRRRRRRRPGGARRRRPGRLRALGRRRPAVVALATPTSYGEIVVVDLTTGAETVLTEHGAAPRRRRAVRARRAHVHHQRRHRGAGLAGPRPRARRDRCRCCSTSTAARTTRGTPRPTRSTSTTRSSPRAAGRSCSSTRAAATATARSSTTAVHGAWGVADANDFLEPIDQLVAEGLADPERLAVTGYSYGGFMTCYLTGHDDRFAAAVAGGVVSDLVSMGGTCDDGHFLSAYELGGAPWQSPTRYAAMSPLTKVADVRTPTLVLHGAADLTCPVGQAQQWHTALRELGVPTQLVLYPDASHVFILLGPPSQRLDFNRRVVDWVEQHAVRGGRARIDARHWEHRLAALAKRHHVPGAQLGILRYSPGREDELVEAAYGTLNLATGSPATTTRCSRSARSPRSGRPPSSCSWSTRAWSSWTPRSSRSCPSSGSPTPTSPRASRSGTCSPTPAASTATSSPTPAAATTAWRSTSTCWPRRRRTTRSARRGRTATPASRSWAG